MARPAVARSAAMEEHQADEGNLADAGDDEHERAD